MDVIIVGAGGHGKVVLDILRAAGTYRPIGFVDADTALAGAQVCGLPVIGPANTLPRLRQQKVRLAVIAIGDNRPRLHYASLLREAGFELINAIHPAASVSPSAVLGTNIVIAAQAAVAPRPGCTIRSSSTPPPSSITNASSAKERIFAPARAWPAGCGSARCAFIGLGASVIQC